jgi:ABC-type nitrate/sulfonate/bicarbonate transport system ATPase subunit
MEDDLLKLWATYRPAVLFITHDLEEAVGLSDRVVVMSASPGHVIGNHAVPLERPRDLLEIKFDPTFTETHEQIWDQLRTEVVQPADVDSAHSGQAGANNPPPLPCPTGSASTATGLVDAK